MIPAEKDFASSRELQYEYDVGPVPLSRTGGSRFEFLGGLTCFSGSTQFLRRWQPSVKIWAEERTVADSNARYIRLNFGDNCIGIAPENHQRIFRMFERIHSPAEYEGTEVGLTIAREAVDGRTVRLRILNRDGEANFGSNCKKVNRNEKTR